MSGSGGAVACASCCFGGALGFIPGMHGWRDQVCSIPCRNGQGTTIELTPPKSPWAIYSWCQVVKRKSSVGLKPKHPPGGLQSSRCISSRLRVTLGKPFRLWPPQLPIPKLGRAAGPWSRCCKGTGLAGWLAAAGLLLSCLAHAAATGTSRLSHAKGPASLVPDLAQICTNVSSPGIVWLAAWKDYSQRDTLSLSVDLFFCLLPLLWKKLLRSEITGFSSGL